MNKLEKMFLPEVSPLEFIATQEEIEYYSKKSAEVCANITEEIAVKFTEFLQKQYYLEDNDWFDYNSEGIRKLFQEFLKTL